MKRKDTQEFQIQKDKCPECGGINTIHDYDTGEIICKECGLVIQDELMNKGPEWRAYTQEEKESRSRVGMPTSYSTFDKGLSTTINRIDSDAAGRKLPLKTRIQMWRLKKWQISSRTHSSIDRNLAQAMNELNRLSDKLSIPKPAKEKAAVIYRKALDKGLVKGRTIAGMVTASLYAACRSTGMPRNLREISKASLVSIKEVSRDYRLLIRELKIIIPISDPTIYLTKIADKAGLSGQIQELSLDVLIEAKEKHVIVGKDPTGLAAAALYIASIQAGDKLTQKDVADAAGVTEVTVRNRYRTLRKQLSLEFD